MSLPVLRNGRAVDRIRRAVRDGVVSSQKIQASMVVDANRMEGWVVVLEYPFYVSTAELMYARPDVFNPLVLTNGRHAVPLRDLVAAAGVVFYRRIQASKGAGANLLVLRNGGAVDRVRRVVGVGVV